MFTFYHKSYYFQGQVLYVKDIKLQQELKRNFSIWVSGFHSILNNKSSGTQVSTTGTINGGVIGLEYREDDNNYALGISFSGGAGKSESDMNDDDINHHRFMQYGAYASFKMWQSAFRFDVFGSVGRTKNNGKRRIKKIREYRYAFAYTRSRSYNFGAQLNYDSEHLRPYIGFNYSGSKQFAYREKGAGRYNQIHDASLSRTLETYIGLSGQSDAKLTDETWAVFNWDVRYEYSPIRPGRKKKVVYFKGLRPNKVSMNTAPTSAYSYEAKVGVSLTNKETYQTTLQVGGVMEKFRKGVTFSLTQKWHF